MHSFDDSQDHLEQLLAFPQVSIGDHCEAMLSHQIDNTTDPVMRHGSSLYIHGQPVVHAVSENKDVEPLQLVCT